MTDASKSGKTGPWWVYIGLRHSSPDGLTAVSYKLINDNTLSMGARGLAAQMLSYPRNQMFSADGLTSAGKESLMEVLALIAELENAGLLWRVGQVKP